MNFTLHKDKTTLFDALKIIEEQMLNHNAVHYHKMFKENGELAHFGRKVRYLFTKNNELRYIKRFYKQQDLIYHLNYIILEMRQNNCYFFKEKEEVANNILKSFYKKYKKETFEKMNKEEFLNQLEFDLSKKTLLEEIEEVENKTILESYEICLYKKKKGRIKKDTNNLLYKYILIHQADKKYILRNYVNKNGYMEISYQDYTDFFEECRLDNDITSFKIFKNDICITEVRKSKINRRADLNFIVWRVVFMLKNI